MRSVLATPREDGAALIVCLLMMLVILLLGTSGAQIAIQEEKASRHERERLLAFQAAEAALRDGELDIEKTARVELFEKDKGDRVPGQCEAGMANPLLGLCHPAPPDMFPVWQKLDPGPERRSVPFGYFTGRSLTLADSAIPPSYLIEVLPGPLPEASSASPIGTAFRVTAIGYGTNERTQVVLQSYYRKSVDGHWQRFGWREIMNWEELRETLEKE